MGFGGLGFRVLRFRGGFRVSGLRVLGFRLYRVGGLRFGVLRFRGPFRGFRVSRLRVLGFRVEGFRLLPRLPGSRQQKDTQK